MSREIKFKAIPNKEASSHNYPVTYFTLEDCIRGKVNFGYPEHFIFVRWTGLKDKNGKEIWEGDVVKCDDFGTYEIKYHHGAFMPLDKDNKGMSQIVEWRDEVIGNIYETPNLLNSND